MDTTSLYRIGVVIVLFFSSWSESFAIDSLSVEFSIPFRHQPQAHSVIVPFSPIYKGLIVISCHVNGQEGNFILDSGANGLVLNKRYFEANKTTAKRGKGLGPGAFDVGQLYTDTFAMDALVFKETMAQIIDLRAIERQKKVKILGLIGFNVLKHFEIMINYRENHVTFAEVNNKGILLDPLPHTLQKMDSFALQIATIIPVVQVTVNGIPKKMGIDTGSEFNLLNIKRSKDIQEQFVIQKRISVQGAGSGKVEAFAGYLYRLALNDVYKCAAMSTLLTNFRSFTEIYHMELDGVLGYPFLSPWLFSINYRKKMLYIHKIEYTQP